MVKNTVAIVTNVRNGRSFAWECRTQAEVNDVINRVSRNMCNGDHMRIVVVDGSSYYRGQHG